MNSKSRKNIKYRNNKKTRKKSYKGGDKSKIQINPILINFKFKEHDKTKISSELLNKQLLGNNEFYIAPVYNELIKDGKTSIAFYVHKMWGIGTPEDLKSFLDNKR